MLKAVFFDIDNTLLDFHAASHKAMREGLALHGITCEESWFSVFDEINNALWSQIEDGSLTRSELYQIRWNRVFQALGFSLDGVAFERYFRGEIAVSAILIPGAKQVLKQVAADYRVYAASNAPQKQQQNRLELAGLLPYFTKVFTSEQLGAEKPDVEFFRCAFAQIEPLRPQEAVMVGDSLHADIAGGIAFGMRTCWFRSGRMGEAVVSESGADATITRLAELLPLLSAWSEGNNER